MHSGKSLVRAWRRRPPPLHARELDDRPQDRDRKRFRSPDCLLPEAKSLVGRRTSLSWIVPGRITMSTSLPSLLGLGSESPHSSTIGSDGWPLNSIALHNSFLAGLSIGKVQAE